jgi:hypothetical protein
MIPVDDLPALSLSTSLLSQFVDSDFFFFPCSRSKATFVQRYVLLFALFPYDVKHIPHCMFQGQSEENAQEFEQLRIEFREHSILQVHGFARPTQLCGRHKRKKMRSLPSNGANDWETCTAACCCTNVHRRRSTFCCCLDQLGCVGFCFVGGGCIDTDRHTHDARFSCTSLSAIKAVLVTQLLLSVLLLLLPTPWSFTRTRRLTQVFNVLRRGA